MATTSRWEIFGMIQAERERQIEKWGDQRSFMSDKWLRILIEEIGEVALAINEHDQQELADELVQSAAVIVAWLEDHLNPPKPGWYEWLNPRLEEVDHANND